MQKDEKKVAGAQYIYSFYNEVESLLAQEAQYINLLLEFQSKYWDPKSSSAEIQKSLEHITETEKTILIGSLQNVRFFCIKIWKKYKAMQPILKLDKKKDLENNYNKIMGSFIINREELSEFTDALNSVLVEDIIGSLMETAQEYLKDVLQDTNETI